MPAIDSVPYAHAKVKPEAARGEITKLLQRFGCQSVGIMDDYERGCVILVFKHHGRQVQMEASAAGWAALWLKSQPAPKRRRGPRVDMRAKALAQGAIAVNAILRDWIKGQITAVECGLTSFDHVFLPYMITSDGRTVLDRIKDAKLLPAPTEAVN